MDKLNVVLVGCGRVFCKYVEVIMVYKGLKLYVVCDIVLEYVVQYEMVC